MVKIRNYLAQDVRMLVQLFVSSVIEIGSRDYTAEQVTAWLSRAPGTECLNRKLSDGRTVLVAVDESDCPIAFGDLENNGHVDYLYCHPTVAGTGVISSLYDHLEVIAHTKNMDRLTSEESEAARRFFLKKNFVVTSKRQLEISGVKIHNYAVEKSLLPQT